MVDTAKIILIADGVTAALNLADFSQEFEAERGYRPGYELPDLSTLKVLVVPKDIAPSPAGNTRGARQHNYRIDVGILKKLSADEATDKAELDALMALVQEIAKDLEGKRMLAGEGDDGKWITTENVPVFIPDHLEQYRQFTSVLTLTYRAAR